MAYTVNSSSTPPIAEVQKNFLLFVELLKRGDFPYQTMNPAMLDILAALGNTANGSTSIVLS